VRIDRELVRTVSRLAALDLAEGEDDLLAGDLTRIVEHFETLRAVSEEVLPPVPEAQACPLRDDAPAGGPGERPFVASNAPELSHGHFVVPRVVSRNG
jgi:aspartyl/glutamyl-tRNA(Asn/Gln) amidotransferase C subunit